MPNGHPATSSYATDRRILATIEPAVRAFAARHGLYSLDPREDSAFVFANYPESMTGTQQQGNTYRKIEVSPQLDGRLGVRVMAWYDTGDIRQWTTADSVTAADDLDNALEAAYGQLCSWNRGDLDLTARIRRS